MAVDIHDQIKDPEKVLKLVRNFIDTYGITDAEIIHESDRIIANSHDFFEELCSAAGWAEVEVDEEEDIELADYDEDNPFLDDDY